MAHRVNIVKAKIRATSLASNSPSKGTNNGKGPLVLVVRSTTAELYLQLTVITRVRVTVKLDPLVLLDKAIRPNARITLP